MVQFAFTVQFQLLDSEAAYKASVAMMNCSHDELLQLKVNLFIDDYVNLLLFYEYINQHSFIRVYTHKSLNFKNFQNLSELFSIPSLYD